MPDDPSRPTRPSPATRAAEAEEAAAAHVADRGPTADEEAAAEGNQVDPAVARIYDNATKRGAAQKGEGRIP